MSGLFDQPVAGASAHADSSRWIQSNVRFVVSNTPKFRTKLLLGQNNEPEMLIQRAVPGDVSEGGEGDGRTIGFDRPHPYSLEQFLTEAQVLELREHADLLNVGVPIDDIDDDVANRPISFVDRDPTASTGCVSPQRVL